MAGFSIDEVASSCISAFDRLVHDLPDDIRERLKRQRVAQRHSAETRMFMFHMYDRHQPAVLDFHHFGYGIVYDPVRRYHPETCIARFYANRHRIYDKRGEVIPALWTQMKKAERKLHGYKACENAQMVALLRVWNSKTIRNFEELAYQSMLELIPLWHSTYAGVIDGYGQKMTREEVEAVIGGRKKFQPSRIWLPNMDGRYSRHIPTALRLQVLARDKYQCLKCGKTDDLHIDHIKPVSKGGLTILKNLQTLCADENLKKGNRESVDYRNA
jgi:hypothetical protein